MAMAGNKILFVAILVLLGKCSFGDDDAVKNVSISREIDVSKLDYYVNTNEGRLILETEYETIPDGQRRPWTIAALPVNIRKNRYEEMLAYDDTRVVLKKLPNDQHSDYINANYVDGYKEEKVYVATQGPLPDTIHDFWRMIWELNATRIVMLANVVEKGSVKVSKYWPESSETYGTITVEMISEHTIEKVNHVVRTFTIKKAGIQTPRTVRQFHFTGWPDLGVPSSTLPVVAIMNQAMLYKPEVKTPIVVHCSAGVGRTGTSILLHSMIQRALAEKMVDFPKRLDEMRLQRAYFVERKEQYVFAHRAVYDVLYSSETNKNLKEVEEEYRKLDNLMSEDNFKPAETLKEGLLRLEKHNKAMEQLLENIMEQFVEEDDEDTTTS